MLIPGPPSFRYDLVMAVSASVAKKTLARLHRAVAHLPEVSERLSHGSPALFIRDKKVLCNLVNDHHGDGRFAIWCAAPPGVQAELVEREPDRFYVPAYVGHRGWIGVDLEHDVDWDEITEILTDAYRLVAPKTLVKALDAKLEAEES